MWIRQAYSTNIKLLILEVTKWCFIHHYFDKLTTYLTNEILPKILLFDHALRVVLLLLGKKKLASKTLTVFTMNYYVEYKVKYCI